MNLQDIKCPSCDKPIDDIRAVTLGEAPSVGDGFMCPCGFIGEFTIDGLRQLTREDFAKLPPDEKADMNFAARCMNIPFNGE